MIREGQDEQYFYAKNPPFSQWDREIKVAKIQTPPAGNGGATRYLTHKNVSPDHFYHPSNIVNGLLRMSDPRLLHDPSYQRL